MGDTSESSELLKNGLESVAPCTTRLRGEFRKLDTPHPPHPHYPAPQGETKTELKHGSAGLGGPSSGDGHGGGDKGGVWSDDGLIMARGRGNQAEGASANGRHPIDRWRVDPGTSGQAPFSEVSMGRSGMSGAAPAGLAGALGERKTGDELAWSAMYEAFKQVSAH